MDEHGTEIGPYYVGEVTHLFNRPDRIGVFGVLGLLAHYGKHERGQADWLVRKLNEAHAAGRASQPISKTPSPEACGGEGERQIVHSLKTWPEPFESIVTGHKRYEIRKNDRGFKVGDILRLEEYDNDRRVLTGRRTSAVVTYMSPGGSWGLPDGLCVMSISLPSDPISDSRPPSPAVEALDGEIGRAAWKAKDTIRRLMKRIPGRDREGVWTCYAEEAVRGLEALSRIKQQGGGG